MREIEMNSPDAELTAGDPAQDEEIGFMPFMLTRSPASSLFNSFTGPVTDSDFLNCWPTWNQCSQDRASPR